MWIFVVFLAVPLIEIGLFVTLGGWLGLWPTLAFVLGSGVLGVAVLRRAGQIGRPRGNPVMQIAGSGMSMLAATLLVAPGFLTSTIGALLLLPPVQNLIVAVLGQRLAAKGFVMRGFSATDARFADRDRDASDEVIDGEFDVVDQPRDDRLPPSKWTQH